MRRRVNAFRGAGAPQDELNLSATRGRGHLGRAGRHEPVVALTMLTSNLLPNADMAILPSTSKA
ncbi:MAG: hypothetical protein ACLSVD_11545 [Eggerthellaceae bacterium]